MASPAIPSTARMPAPVDDRPLAEAVTIVRIILAIEKRHVTVKDAKRALLKSHDGEWHHTSKYGNRTHYYDPGAAIALLRGGN